MFTSLFKHLAGGRSRSKPVDPGDREAALRTAEQAVAAGDYRRAVEASYAYLQSHPPTTSLLNNLGVALRQLGDLGAAEEELRIALSLDPNYAIAWNNLGLVKFEQAELAAAEQYYRQAIAVGGAIDHFHHSLLTLLNYRENYSQQDIAEAHRQWGLRYEGQAAKHWEVSSQWPRRLRIGLVSADLFDHSIAYFISGVLAHHDPHELELICYDNRGLQDEVALQLRGLVEHWRVVGQLDDDQLERLIRQDAIDILVDLSGHTLGNRLAVFARKPAPLQVTWIGYPQTTGLSAIDYRLTDTLMDPPAEWFGAEKPWYLPHGCVCFTPPPHLTAQSNRRDDAPVVFLSANNYCKISDSTIRVWSRILRALPDSTLRIFVQHADDQNVRSGVLKRFDTAGVTADHIDLRPRCATVDFFAQLAEVDIALDAFPYNGGTTTNLLMWAGLPVIAMAGQTPPSRAGQMLLSSLGLDQLVAHSEDQYVEIAVQLAADREALPLWRPRIRQAFIDSPLYDCRGFTRAVEQAFKEMWTLKLAELSDPSRS